MSDSENNPLNDLLSSFALGPSWARATGGAQEKRADKPESKSGDRPPRRDERRDDRRDDGRKGGFRERDGERRPFRAQRGDDDRRGGPPRHEEAPPAEGVRVILIPDPQALHLIGKEIHQVARVYPLFDVAKILLAERVRCRAVFETAESHPPLLRGKLDDSVFLTREEVANHLWQSELRAQFIEEETIEVDPPRGNFQLVAKCGLTGLWLGPPNFHAYQVNLRRIHRECFPSMPFDAYTARVRTERGEEAVNAWLETMKKKTRWRIKGDGDDAWIDDLAEAQRALTTRCFDQAFEETRCADVLASIAPKNLSPSLMTSLKIAGNHARNHPAILIPAVCKAVEAEHLPVFKRQGKLFTGPARPHPLPPGQALAERPAIMVEWIRANKPAKLEGLWKAVLPEGGTAPPAEFAADLFWLLHQGHILLFTDDTLVVQEIREALPALQEGEAKAAKKKKRKANKPKPEGPVAVAADAASEVAPDESPADENPADESPADENPADDSPADDSPADDSPANEAPIVETPVTETPMPETPAPETPAPEAPPCETPLLESPHPEAPPIEVPHPELAPCETPIPEAPPVETPVPETPPIENPVPEIPAPVTPSCDTPVPETPIFSDPVTEPSPPSDESTKNPTPGVDDPPAL